MNDLAEELKRLKDEAKRLDLELQDIIRKRMEFILKLIDIVKELGLERRIIITCLYRLTDKGVEEEVEGVYVKNGKIFYFDKDENVVVEVKNREQLKEYLDECEIYFSHLTRENGLTVLINDIIKQLGHPGER